MFMTAREVTGMMKGIHWSIANHIFSAPRSRRPPGIRLIVSGVSRDTSWQVGGFPRSLPALGGRLELFVIDGLLSSLLGVISVS